MKNVSLPDEKANKDRPKIMMISNLENQFALTRREILKAIGMGILSTSVAPLLMTGCATLGKGKKLKMKTPKKVKAKTKIELRESADESAAAVGTIDKGEEVRVLDYKDDWLKVKSQSGKVGWIKFSAVQIAEYMERVLPCGSPLPPGAICLCNCIPTYTPSHICSCDPHTYRYCSCVPVCTCDLIPVPY